jgi:transcription-repair coupling factor (superfamily II helicase)
MPIDTLLKIESEIIQIEKSADALKDGLRVQLEGLTASAKGLFLAGLFSRLDAPLLVITSTSDGAERIADDLSQFGFGKDAIFVLPPSDSLIYEEGAPDYRVIGQRLAAVNALASGKRCIVTAPINGALRRAMPPDTLRNSQLKVEVGRELNISDFISNLVKIGYERAEICERHGEFSQRGGIIDVYPSNEDEPIRIELFGDEVESIRSFDPASQRSTGRLNSTVVIPAREVILSPENAASAAETIRAEMMQQIEQLLSSGKNDEAERLRNRIEDNLTQLSNLCYFDGIEAYLPYIHPDNISVFDYLPDNGILVIDEPSLAAAQWQQLEEEMIEVLVNRANRGLLLASTRSQHVPMENTLKSVCRHHPTLIFTVLPRQLSFIHPEHKLQINSTPVESFAGRINHLADQCQTWIGNGMRVIITTNQKERMLEILAEQNVPAADETTLEPECSPGLYAVAGALRSGFKLPDARIIVLTDTEIFGITRFRKPRKVAREGIPISTVLDLKEGDYVVHVAYGIGIFKGITRMTVDGVARDYLLLEYAGEDRLFVPTDQIDRVQKYIGGEGSEPVIHRLGGSEWSRATRRAKQAAREIAGELIELYAWRKALGGYAFGPDTVWQQEMESAFPFEETPDQIQAIEDVKRDLEEPKPMDRLICGDVGYGKTEVAVRAAFKVVNEGKQVAMLAPTTVLAAQHLSTFRERLGAFPINIEMLSRFRTRKEQKQVIEGLKLGTVDIVIGTHRLLSNDIQFRDLGLLIIDEEQRFGVVHKEKLRQMKKTVDTLSMTATPIPRTLHMSLSGIRDMSIINDPPIGRTPIKTFVCEYDDEIVREAIVRELDRGGQVYYVHNRVEDIAHIAAHVSKLVPYARIQIGHGQMDEDDLERVMLDFYDRQFDVLVCTTIVESGLDIPNVNTILVDDADKMGLAQLYQLRGRVGRSDKQAYAYLMYKKQKQLSEIAEKRLEAIREFTELGSGLRLALRDLEIRGAGNLLGAEQHGQIAAVGFDLYCQILAQAIAEMKGEPIEAEPELPSVDLPVDAYIPETYINIEAQRVYFYKKIAAARSLQEVQRIQDELDDRFGDPPKQVWHLLAILRLRIRCRELGIDRISLEKRQIVIRFAPGFRLTPEVRQKLAKTYKNHWFAADHARLNIDSPRILDFVEDMVEIIGKGLKTSAKQLQRAEL